jgi:hypothetical protein
LKYKQGNMMKVDAAVPVVDVGRKRVFGRRKIAKTTDDDVRSSRTLN